MSNESFTALISVFNIAAFILSVLLMGVILATLIIRVALYQKAKQRIPLLLKRDVVLFAALVIVFGESLLIRALGITAFSEPGPVRLLFIIQQNVLGIAALAYWAKVELSDL